MDITQFREKYPQYDQIQDADLADKIYTKFYAGRLDRQQFMDKIGLSAPIERGALDTPEAAPAQPPPDPAAMSQDAGGLPFDDGMMPAHQTPDQMPLPASHEPTEGFTYLQKFMGEGAMKPNYSMRRAAGQLVEGSKDVVRQALVGAGVQAHGAAQVAEKTGERIRQSVRNLGMPTLPEGEGRTAFPGQEKLAKGMMEASKAEAIQANPEYLNSAGFFEDVIRMGPQVLSQIGAAALTGPAGATMFMGSQIAGSTYEELIANGVPPDRASKAAMANAIMQAPLESIGIDKAMSLWTLRSGVLESLKNAGASLGIEWLTEFLQSFPDAAAEIWAKNPDKTTLEKIKEFASKAPHIAKQGAYEGAVTLPFTAIGLTARSIFQRKANAKRVSKTEGRDLYPEIKSTQEAIDFGKQATDDQIKTLQQAWESNKQQMDALKNQAESSTNDAQITDLNDARLDLAYKNQFIREAIESYQGADYLTKGDQAIEDRRAVPRETQERRQDVEQRKRWEDMNDEERRTAYFTDEMTGLPNDRAYAESEPKKLSFIADLDSLKWVNDNLGHDVGDALIKRVADAFKESGVEIYRRSAGGDEFPGWSADQSSLDAGMQKAYDYLKRNPIVLETPKGTTIEFTGGFTYGSGTTTQEADLANNAAKIEREKSGLRAPRGETPPGVLEKGPERVKTENRQQSDSGQKVVQFKQELSQRLSKKSKSGQITIEGRKTGTSFEFDKDLETRWKAAHGAGKEKLTTRLKNTMADIGRKMSREFEHLPRTGEFSEAGFALRKLQNQKDVSMEESIKSIGGITAKLDKDSFNLFERKVFMDDMAETAAEGKKLPFGLDDKKIKSEMHRLDQAIDQNHAAREAIERRNAVWDDIKGRYTQAMKDVGFDVSERLSRKNYFRHQILDYIQAKGIWGSGKRLKTPTNRGHLKGRQGSSMDINTNYLEAEHEVMAQMLYDIQIAKTIKVIDNKYNIKPDLMKQAKKDKTSWENLIPDGYVEWQPREGNVFFMTDTVPARLAEQLTSGAMEQIGITAKDLGRALAIGNKRASYVVKQEVADTLDQLYKNRSENVIVGAHRKIMRGWKIWQLISPRRYAKYNLRNITGDADAAFAGNPSGFKKVPAAVNDLYNSFTKKQNSENLQDFFERGGMGATLQAQEMGSINNLKMFAAMIQKKGGVKDIPGKVWRGYWKAARLSTDFREAILRYANYLSYLDQMKSSPDSMPKNFGASIPEEVKGLSDIKDRAYMLQNDLLGAYDRISVFGQAMREQIFPFWSWKEANAKRYYRLFANAAHDGKLASTIGRKFAAKSPYIAYKTGKLMIKASAFWALLQVWNHSFFPEEEDQLPEGIRQKPHIIFGRDKNGKINYFSRLGAVPDLLEWFGLDAAPEYVDRLMRGDSPAEIAKEMAKQPINIMANGSLPFAKQALEMATRRALFPDVFKPRTIRDRALYLAQSFGLGDEYKQVVGLPHRPYKESLENLIIYKIDPLEAAYGETYDMKSRYLKKIGKFGEGFWLTRNGQNIYNAKLAIRYGDKKASNYYLEKYFKEGGTVKGMLQSLKAMDPLSGMSDKEKLEFLEGLKKEEKLKVALAYEFFARMFDHKKDN